MEVKYISNSNLELSLNHSIALAIGNFDGVHTGHKKIISKLKTEAANRGLKTAILTFEPHPISVFNPEAKNYRITPENNKIKLLEETGIDYLFIARFDTEFSQISAHNFIEKILVKNLNAKAIFTGKDFIFGHNRGGNSHLLEVKSEELGCDYCSISDVVDEDNIRYSSSRIRELIKAGEIETANQFLQSNFTISGKVKKGRQDGRKLGYPTANLELGEYVIPKFGVYKAMVKIEGDTDKKPAAVNIGIRPTFDQRTPILEAHIINFSKDIYEKTIHVELLNYIREEKKFNDLEELKKQIKKDIENIKNKK